MSYDAFMLIHKYLHLSNNQTSNKGDPLAKVRPLLAHLIFLYRTFYNPFPKVSIDEFMIKYDGRLYFKQYIQNKPTKWGIKGYLMSDADNGYCYKIRIYGGQKEFILDENLSSSENTVLRFLDGYECPNTTVYIDNYYTGPKLLEELHKRGIACVGTVKQNRILPLKPLPSTLPKNTMKHYTNYPDNTLLLTLWHDRGMVRLLSNNHLPIISTVKTTRQYISTLKKKPQAAIEYSKYAKGVDLCNQLSTTYKFPHRNKKWWKSIFYH